jgi:CheY-like chemotaxis protein
MGSVFTVIIPRVQRARPSAEVETCQPDGSAEKPTLPAKLDSLRILVVDDMQETRDGFALMLASAGANVRTASSAADGFAALTEFKPDVLLCDLAMPGEDGYSLIRRIRKLGPRKGGHIPAIALTAFASADNIHQALEASFNMHIAKPVDMISLTHAIAGLAKRGR